MSWTRKLFCLAAVLFFLSRLAVLFSDPEAVSDLEELYRGTIAFECLHGLKAPLLDYQADPYSGGSIVTGLLAAPFFYALGPTLFALKMVPLLLSFLSLILLFFFLRRHFGDLPAAAGAFLFVFPPPAFSRLSLLAMGFHTESILFSILIFFSFYEYFFGKKRTVFLLLWGMAGGLGFSFTYITLISFAACLTAWLVLEPSSIFRKKSFLLIPAFGMGMIPSFYYNLTRHWEGFRFFGRIFFKHSGTQTSFLNWPLKIYGLITEGIPQSFHFPSLSGLSGDTFSLLYYLIAVGIFLLFVWKQRRVLNPKMSPLLLFVPIFVFVYSVSSYGFAQESFLDARYFMPLHFVFFCLLGIASLERICRPGVVLLLILGLWGQTGFVTNGFPGKIFSYRGYSYYQLGYLWSAKDLTRDEAESLAERFPEPDRRSFLLGLFNSRPFSGEEISGVKKNALIYQAAGSRSLRCLKSAADCSAEIEKIPGEEREGFYAGLGRKSYGHPELLEKLSLDEDERGWFYQGMGQELATVWSYDRVGLENALKKLRSEMPEAEREDLWRGLGWGLRFEMLKDPERARDWINKLSPGVRAFAEEGFKACGDLYE